MTRQQRATKANLPAAIRDLRSAIDRLIEPTPGYLNNAYIEAPGLYTALRDAISSHITSGGRGLPKSFPPVWDEAFEQLANIDLMVGVWANGASTTNRLRALAEHPWNVEQTRDVRSMADIINAWADDIETLLNDSVKRIGASCPNCGAQFAQRRDSAGELVRTPALQLTADQGCTCLNCDYQISTSQRNRHEQPTGVSR